MSSIVKRRKLIMDNISVAQENKLRVNLVLNNELILANVLKYLSGKELKILRKVSRFWNEICLPILQKKCLVNLTENVHSEGSLLQDFLEAFATVPCSQIWFQNFKMSLWNLDEETNAIIAYWEKFGPCMESLELSWVRMVGVEIVRDVFFRHTPKLKRLAVKDCSFYDSMEGVTLNTHKNLPEVNWNTNVNRNLVTLELSGQDPHTHPPISWQEIFTGFPNLQHLEFYNVNLPDTSSILENAAIIKAKFPNSLRLEKLNIFNGDYAATEIPQSIVNQLLSLKLPLKELSIDIGSHCHDYSIAKILEQYQNVKKLIIYRGPLGTPMPQFPFQVVFPNLRVLEMTETVADSMQFLQYMPKLTSFSLCEPPEVEPPFLPSDLIMKTDINFAAKTLPVTLTNLRIDYDISCGDVKKLVYWFPNVKFARLYLDNEGFRTVCGEWPNLEELEVLGDKLDSSGITGIAFKKTKGTGVTHRTYHPTNITCLKSLRKFVVQNYKMSTEIDDLSITEGFLKLKHLNYIELCSRHITEDGWRKLFDCDHIQTLLPTDGKWKSECEQFIKMNCSRV